MRLINMEEIWKDIPGYDGIYQVSNFGNVRSFKCNKIKLLKPLIDKNGYYLVRLSNNGKQTSYKIHQLVAITFLNHIPNGHKIVINHIDKNPLNNNVKNLEIVTQRYNLSCHKTDCGIYWYKNTNKWNSRITIKNKKIHLGYFLSKEEGLLMYNLALNNLHLYNGNPKEFRLKLREKV